MSDIEGIGWLCQAKNDWSKDPTRATAQELRDAWVNITEDPFWLKPARRMVFKTMDPLSARAVICPDGPKLRINGRIAHLTGSPAQTIYKVRGVEMERCTKLLEDVASALCVDHKDLLSGAALGVLSVAHNGLVATPGHMSFFETRKRDFWDWELAQIHRLRVNNALLWGWVVAELRHNERLHYPEDPAPWGAREEVPGLAILADLLESVPLRVIDDKDEM